MSDDKKRLGDGKRILIVARTEMSRALLQVGAKLRSQGNHIHVGNIAKYKVIVVYTSPTVLFSDELTALFEEQVYELTVKSR